MKLWKRCAAAALMAAMLLTLLTACGPSGPEAPAQSEKPGSSETGGGTGKDPTDKPGSEGSGENASGSETGKDPAEQPGTEEPGKSDPEDENNEKTEEQKAIEATVKALNAVRAAYGQNTPLVLDAQACAIAKQMAQVQMDGVNGKYGKNPTTDSKYITACSDLRRIKVQAKECTGVGALQGAYPNEKQFRKWAEKAATTTDAAGNSKVDESAQRNNALVLSKDTTRVGVGVVPNPDTTSQYKYMVVVMTY